MTTDARGNPAHWWKSHSCGRGNRAPGAMFISPFRRLTSLGTLSGLVLLLGGGWYVTSPKRISRLAETLLSNTLGGRVTVRTGHLSLSGTLLLSGVEVRTAEISGPGGAATRETLPVFSADQIEARFDWISLLAGELRATQLTAIRPTLYLIEDRDVGKWNYECFRERPATTGPATAPGAGGEAHRTPLPVIVLRDARVQWAEYQARQLHLTADAVVEGQLSPIAGSPFSYRFELDQRGEAGAVAANADAGGVAVTGTWDIASGKFAAATREIVLSDFVKDALPRQVRAWWSEHDLHGRFSQLWMTFDNEAGLVVGADLDRVSMVQTITPTPDAGDYHVDVSDLRGTLTFGITKPSVRATALRGKVQGFDFIVDGVLSGPRPDSLIDMRIRFPSLFLGEDYPALFMAIPQSQDLLQRVAPHGVFDMGVVVKRDEGSTALHVKGDIECHNARMRFGPFPVPLDHLNGKVTFDENTVRFEQVTANADDTLVHLQGTTGTTPANKAIDFKVWADNAIFDDRLAAALPDQYKAVWEQLDLTAKGSFFCEVTRGTGQADAPDVQVELVLADGHGYAKALPYHFDHLHGRLLLNANQTEVSGLTVNCGGDDSGQVRFDGVLHHPGGDVTKLTPDLHVKADVPLDGSLVNAIPQEYSAKVAMLTLGGRAGFDGTLKPRDADAPGGPPLSVAGAVSLHDGTVATADGSLRLSQVQMAANLEAAALEVKSVQAMTAEGVKLSAQGAVNLAEGRGAFTLAADGHDLVLPARAPGLLPTEAREAWESYHPAGKIDLRGTAAIHLGGAPAVATAPATLPAPIFSAGGVTVDRYACTVTAKGVSVQSAALPQPVHDITGIADITPARVQLKAISAQTGSISILCAGTYERETGAASLAGSASTSGVPAEWVPKLPEGVGKFLQAHPVTGDLRVAVTALERAGADRPWNFDGTLSAEHLAIQDLAGISAQSLTVAARGSWSAGTGNTPNALDFHGTLNGTGVGAGGKTFDTLAAGLALDPKDKTVRFTDIDGKVAGGSVQGKITLALDGAGRYEANLVLNDAELNQLALPPSATEEDRKKFGSGRVSATLAVQQTFGDQGDRTGRGELIVRDGKIYNVPLAMGLMQLVTLRLPVARAFNEASMSYYLRDNKVTFERILLESPTINLAGSGTLSLRDSTLDLNFVTESPNELKLPLISTIIDQIRLELLQLSVTGPVDNPRVLPVPLSPIASSLRLLLPHRKQASER